ncbi:unnamed protein product, partial [Polarella glacialis]
VMEFTFINADAANTFIITDGTGTYKLGPYESVTAHCWSGGGNRLYFPEASGSTSFCSKGCDAAVPNDRSGTAFTATQNLVKATARWRRRGQQLEGIVPLVAMLRFQSLRRGEVLRSQRRRILSKQQPRCQRRTCPSGNPPRDQRGLVPEVATWRFQNMWEPMASH